MSVDESIQVELILHDDLSLKDEYDLNQIIYDLDCHIDLLSNQADDKGFFKIFAC